MSTEKKAPLRGEAAWRACRDAIAKRNDIARAAAAERRAQHEIEAAQAAARRERRDALDARRLHASNTGEPSVAPRRT